MTNYQRRIIDPYKNLLFLPAGMNNRGVAQLVAYYVRDVGAGSSSLLTPTKEKAWHESAGLFLLKQTQAFIHDWKDNILSFANF